MTLWSSTMRNYVSADQTIRYCHSRDERPKQAHFRPHYESGFEIFMFISGSGTFTVEGNRYELEPYSILMMNSDELHVLNISEDLPYERIVFTISEGFLPPFMLNGVDFFRAIKYRKPGQGNQIKAETVMSSGLLELIRRLEEQYLANPSDENEIVAKCVLVQILSTINRIADSAVPQGSKSAKRTSNYKVGDVLEYINSNLDRSLTLDELADRFYLTKYHLCRTFKEATGYSVNQYITFKRIRMADGLMLEGHTPTQACFMSGFNSYSNFFKSYRKLTGKSPRSGKK